MNGSWKCCYKSFKGESCSCRDRVYGSPSDYSSIPDRIKLTKVYHKRPYHIGKELDQIERNRILDRDCDCHALGEIKNDKKECKKVFAECGLALGYAPDEIKDDKECCKVAISQNGDAFRYVSDRLRDDVECARLSVENTTANLRYASDRVVRLLGYVPKEIVPNLCTDEEFMRLYDLHNWFRMDLYYEAIFDKKWVIREEKKLK